MSGFSRAGLIQQLTSKMGEGFKMSDAVFAVNHVKVDWNKEAVESAKSYLDMSSFSRAGLIQQLSSKAGDQFTVAQATYAANHVGL
jgi:host cell surface-exposed lipoprotein